MVSTAPAMKTHLAALLFAAFTASALAQGGALTPPGAPAPTMRSLQEIWDKVSALESLAQSQQTQITQLQSLNTMLTQQNVMVQTQNNQMLQNAGLPLQWNTALVNETPPGVGSASSLAFLPDGTPVVASVTLNGLNLILETLNGAEWQSEVITTGTGLTLPSLVIDPAGQPVVAFSDNVNGLRIARKTGGTWTLSSVDASGIAAKAAYDPAGRLRIGYFVVGAPSMVKLATLTGVNWSFETLSSDVGITLACSLAITPTGHPAVAYFDQVNGDMKYTVFNGTSWSTTTVDADSTALTVRLRFSPTTGHAALAYDATDLQGIRYASSDGSTWTVSLVGVNGGMDFVFNPLGRPVIASGGTSLRVATFNGTAFETKVVDGTTSTGTLLSAALGADHLPAISYYDSTGQSLRFARPGFVGGN